MSKDKENVNKRQTRSQRNKDGDTYYINDKDQDGFEPRFINDEIGQGVFATKSFEKGEFLLQYRGDWISEEEADSRHEEYNKAGQKHNYQYFLTHNSKTMCIDATHTPGLGKLVNDAAPRDRTCNSKMKKIVKESKVYLCLFAFRKIKKNEQIMYSYDDKDDGTNLPWRNCSTQEFKHVNNTTKSPSTKNKDRDCIPSLSEVTNMEDLKDDLLQSAPVCSTPTINVPDTASESLLPDSDDNDSDNIPPPEDIDSPNSDDNDSDYIPPPEDIDCSPDVIPLAKSRSDKETADMSGVTVMKTNNKNGKRTWDKVAYCPFCETPQTKLPRHLEIIHRDNLEVIKWKAAKDKMMKDRLLTEMRNLGNYKHNIKVLKEKKGILIPAYRPDHNADPSHYLPCQYCLGFFAKYDLWKHSCKLDISSTSSTENTNKKDATENANKNVKRKCHTKVSKFLLPWSEDIQSEYSKKILAGLRSDEDSRIIKSDSLILKLTDEFSTKLGHDNEQYCYVRTKLREIARLVPEYRQLTNQPNASLTDMIDPTEFNSVVEAAKRTAGFDTCTHLYATPTLAVKLGHSLKKAANILMGDAIINSDKATEERARGFEKLHDLRWTKQVSTHAHRTLRENRRNKPKLLPLTEDVVTLTKYVKARASETRENLKCVSDNSEQISTTWRELAELTLTNVMVFNKKRQGEISKMTVSDFQKCSRGREDMITQGLSEWENKLCHIMWRVELVGKKGNTVPVLITNQMKEDLQLLQNKRQEAGILEDNNFMFPLYGSTGHIRGADVLRKHVNDCGCKCPNNITGTSLRKHIAVVSQVMNLKNNELDILAKFMGHDIRTHREYYRLPDEVMQMAKVSKVLIKFSEGDIKALAGKTLDQIELREDEEAEVDEDEAGEETEEAGDETEVAGPSCEETTVNHELIKAKKSVASKEQAKKQSGKRQGQRRDWTCEEKSAVHRQLGQYFTKGTTPGKSAVQQALDKEPCLHRRTWRNVKDFIRNANARKKKKMELTQWTNL